MSNLAKKTSAKLRQLIVRMISSLLWKGTSLKYFHNFLIYYYSVEFSERTTLIIVIVIWRKSKNKRDMMSTFRFLMSFQELN